MCPIRKSFLLVIISMLLSATHALANTSGFYACNFYLGSTPYPQDLEIRQSNNVISGVQYTSGTQNIFSDVTGTASENNISMRFVYRSLNYTVDVVGALNGETMSGNWSSSYGQAGSFTCQRTKLIVGERSTTTNLFCIRGGIGLSTARCSATIADVGAPPRKTPTGSVEFVARDGFFPEAGSCQLTQTPYSPGVSSCELQFQVPSGFPVGAAFPIDISYKGDTDFSNSEGSHKLIQAGCIGGAGSPCSGAVALNFSGTARREKGVISGSVSCGGPALKARDSKKTTSSCSIVTAATLSTSQMIADLRDISAFKSAATELEKAKLSAKAFTEGEAVFFNSVSDVISDIATHETTYQQLYPNIINDEPVSPETEAQILKMLQQTINRNSKVSRALGRKASAKISATPLLAQVESTVEQGKQSNIKLKISKGLNTIFSVMERAGLTAAPVEFSIRSSRSGKILKGTPKRANAKGRINVVIAPK